MLEAQGFQYLRISGIPRLGLLHRRQSQPVKEHLAKLLGRIYLEFSPRQCVDIRLQVCNLPANFFGLLQQALTIHIDSPLLHIRQHLHQGKFHLPVKLFLLTFRKAALHRLVQPCQQPGLPDSFFPVISKGLWHGFPGEILPRQLAKVILRKFRTQKIIHQLDIKELRSGQPCLIIALGIKHHSLAACFQSFQQRLPGGRAKGYEHPGAAAGHCRPLQPAKGVPAGKYSRQSQRTILLQAVCHILCLFNPLITEIRQPVFLLLREKAVFLHIEPLEVLPDLVQFMLLAKSLHLSELWLDAIVLFPEGKSRHSQLDGGKLLGEQRLFLVFLQLFLQLLARNLMSVGQHFLQAAILKKQLGSSLGPYPRHTGNIIRGITHQPLQVDKLDRLEAVLLTEGLIIVKHDVGNPLLGKHHRETRPHQLQGIPVPSNHNDLQPRSCCLGGKSADNIISLIIVLFQKSNAIGTGIFLQQGNLRLQLCGSFLAGALVLRIPFRAESMTAAVEGNGQKIRLHLRQQLGEHIIKAHHSPGGRPLRIRQGRHSIKSPEDKAASIQNDEFL